MVDKRLHKLRSTSDWNVGLETSETLYKLEIAKFASYLKTHGYSNSSVASYKNNLKIFLKYSKTTRPNQNHIEKFYIYLSNKNISKSTINNYSYAIKAYFEMNGEDFKYKVLRVNSHIPYYFTKNEIERFFSVINNIKHLALFMIGFYACLRSSELTNIQDQDLNLKDLSIRINNGKGGKDGIVFINNECAEVLSAYLRVRPPFYKK